MQGGFKGNVIPDQATLNLNTRLIPLHKDVETVKRWLNEIIIKCEEKDEAFRAEILDSRAAPPLDVPPVSEIVRMLKDILKTEPIGAPYYTEAVSYTVNGIPTVICGPGNIDQAHTPDEYITLEQLELGVNVFKETIKRVCL